MPSVLTVPQHLELAPSSDAQFGSAIGNAG